LVNLRVGLIGLGHMGHHHAKILSNLPGVDLVGVYDKFNSRQLSSPPFPLVNSLDDLLDLTIDYAVIATPTQQHYEAGLILAQSGIHAFIEKPVCHNLDCANQLASLYEKKGLIGGVGYIERYNPAIIEAKKRIDQLGKLYQIITRRQSPLPERVKDVGVIDDLLTHDIDLTSWLVDQEFASVFAHINVSTHSNYEDIATVLGTLCGGITSNHLVNRLNPFQERIVIIHGENGVFIANTLTSELTFYPQESYLFQLDSKKNSSYLKHAHPIYFDYPKMNPLLLEHQNFRDAILGKKANIISLKRAAKTIAVTEAISKSVKNRMASSIF